MCVDWNKPIQTKSGKPARYLGELETRACQKKIVAIKGSYNEFTETFREDGTGGRLVCNDIINVPEEVWVNTYANTYNNGSRSYVSGVMEFSTYEAARTAARKMCANPVATIKVSP